MTVLSVQASRRPSVLAYPVAILGGAAIMFGLSRVIGISSNPALCFAMVGVTVILVIVNYSVGFEFLVFGSVLAGYLNRVSYNFGSVGLNYLYAFSQIALFAASLTFLASRPTAVLGWRIGTVDLSVMLLTLWLLLSAGPILVDEPTIGAYGLRFRFTPILMYFWARVYVQRQEQLVRIYRVMALILLMSVSYGLYQRVIGLPALESTWIEAFTNILEESLSTAGGGQGGWYNDGQLRVFSTFSGGNEFGYVAVFLALLLFAYNPLPWSLSQQALRILALVLALVSFAVIRERTPIAMFLAGLLVLLLMRVRPYQGAVVLAICAAIYAALVSYTVHLHRSQIIAALGGRLDAIRLVELATPWRANTVVWRIREMWIPSLDLVGRNLLGYGLGITRYSRVTRDGGLLIAPHNTFLEIVLETGVVGIALFAAVMVSVTRLCLRSRQPLARYRTTRSLPDAVVSVLGAAVACGLVSTVLLDVAALLFWFVIGLMPAVISVAERDTI